MSLRKWKHRRWTFVLQQRLLGRLGTRLRCRLSKGSSTSRRREGDKLDIVDAEAGLQSSPLGGGQHGVLDVEAHTHTHKAPMPPPQVRIWPLPHDQLTPPPRG